MKIVTRELTPERWPDFEALFGASNGGCGGCWCMFWRVDEGEKYANLKGARAKQRMKALILDGKAKGVLAYDGDAPVAWLSYGPRREYPKLDRAPSLACDDADDVWSMPCFFVKAGHRGKGVATALLSHAVKSVKKAGGKIAEGYPYKVSGKSPAAFIWTGVPQLFEREGFEVVEKRAKGKQRMRKKLR